MIHYTNSRDPACAFPPNDCTIVSDHTVVYSCLGSWHQHGVPMFGSHAQACRRPPQSQDLNCPLTACLAVVVIPCPTVASLSNMGFPWLDSASCTVDSPWSLPRPLPVHGPIHEGVGSFLVLVSLCLPLSFVTVSSFVVRVADVNVHLSHGACTSCLMRFREDGLPLTFDK